MEDIGVAQPLESSGYFFELMRTDKAAPTWAFVVDAPYQNVSGVAGVSGNDAKP